MATGVQPRDEDMQFTRTDFETLQEAMKQKKFRELLNEYCEEVSDPANQALYQKEMTQLEKERGYDVTFINPKGGYVIKTSVAGDRKAFINICSNDNVAKPSCNVEMVNMQRGMNWQIPYSLIPPREDYNTAKKERFIIYDVVFHPDTLRMAEVNKRFRELVNKTAFDGLKKQYNIHLDNNNFRFPKSQYKGFCRPAVIRKEDPNFVPAPDEEVESLTPELIEKLYPQHNYNQNATANEDFDTSKETKLKEAKQETSKRKTKRGLVEFQHNSDSGYTIPKYVIKQQKNVDLQDYTYEKDCKQYTAIPSQIVIEINMPLLSSTKDCILDVQEKKLSLKSEKPAKYKLNITLPYCVNDELGSAKFDKSRHMLIVTLPVVKKNTPVVKNDLKVDSGVESEENCGSQSEDENKERLVQEISSTPAEPLVQSPQVTYHKEDEFFNPVFGYILPSYTHNAMDDIVAFTFHVKNTEPDSVKVKKENNRIFIKFTSIGSGFVPVHYGALIIFDESINFENATGEAWDNNVILQLELAGETPQKFQIGLSEDSMTTEHFDVSQLKKTNKTEPQNTVSPQEEVAAPVVEVTNLGTETNIVVSSITSEYDEDDDIESPTAKEEIVWSDPSPLGSRAKSILRKPSMTRSFSESSVGDVASSMDYISSDCIPEESSFKKTVRFSDVIAKQFYRYNSSIEGQKKKNQRKKSKKRSQDRRKSESEAEDDVFNLTKVSKPKKSAMKQRRDSGLADTSDVEGDYRNTPQEYDSSVDSRKNVNIHSIADQEQKVASETSDETENTKNVMKTVLNIVDNKNEEDNSEPAIWESHPSKSKKDIEKEKVNKVTCENIKHNTDLYDPDKLNKGQYLEVTFKNDLIFDLDM